VRESGGGGKKGRFGGAPVLLKKRPNSYVHVRPAGDLSGVYQGSASEPPALHAAARAWRCPRRMLVEVPSGAFRVFFSSRRRHTRLVSDWSSDVCSSD